MLSRATTPLAIACALLLGSGGATAMPNPFVETGSQEEARAAAGFGFSLPSPLEGTVLDPAYRVIPGLMVEAIYRDAQGNESYRLRKGANADDISGDYNRYACAYRLVIAGKELLLKGDCERWPLATWVEGGHSFAILSGHRPLSSGEIRKLAGGLR